MYALDVTTVATSPGDNSTGKESEECVKSIVIDDYMIAIYLTIGRCSIIKRNANAIIDVRLRRRRYEMIF